ncbi:MAG: YciI family protein [Clostridium sp.]|uniref:YciI family protein n=1 Tax=Clostridium sp. TaxID=1506 RepID=UPI002FC6D000
MILYAAFLETVDKEKDAEILQEHLDYLYGLIDEGKVFAKGPFTDHSGGLIIYKASSIEEAKEWIEKDPVVRDGSRKYTLKEWRSNVEA